MVADEFVVAGLCLFGLGWFSNISLLYGSISGRIGAAYLRHLEGKRLNIRFFQVAR